MSGGSHLFLVNLLIKEYRNFPGGPAILRLCLSTAGGVGSIPGWGTKIPHATGWGQTKRERERERERKRRSGTGLG